MEVLDCQNPMVRTHDGEILDGHPHSTVDHLVVFRRISPAQLSSVTLASTEWIHQQHKRMSIRQERHQPLLESLAMVEEDDSVLAHIFWVATTQTSDDVLSEPVG